MLIQLIVFTGILSGQTSPPTDCPARFTQCRSELVQGYHLRAKLCFDDYLQHCAHRKQVALAHEFQVLAARLAEQSPRRVIDHKPRQKSAQAVPFTSSQQRKDSPGRRQPLGKKSVQGPARIEHEPFAICAEPLIAGDEDQAALCFQQLAKLKQDPAQQELADDLAQFSLDMQQARELQKQNPDAQIRQVLQHNDDDKLRLALSIGRSAGFVAATSIYAGFIGLHLGAAQRDLGHLGAGLGAAAGAGLAVAALTLPGGLKAQDLTLIESSLFIAGVNGLLLDVTYSPKLYLGSEFQPDSLFGLSASLLPAALGITTAYLTDLPEAGLRMATSLALWTSSLYFLARLSLPQDLRLLPPQIMPIGLGMAISADLVYLAALGLSPWNPQRLDQIWAMDLGVVSGGVAAYALSYYWLANTRMHTATTALGMMLGGLLAFGLEDLLLKKFVDSKFRDVEPLMLTLQSPREDEASLYGPSPRHSAVVSADQNPQAQGLAFGLRWRGDLLELLAPAL